MDRATLPGTGRVGAHRRRLLQQHLPLGQLQHALAEVFAQMDGRQVLDALPDGLELVEQRPRRRIAGEQLLDFGRSWGVASPSR